MLTNNGETDFIVTGDITSSIGGSYVVNSVSLVTISLPNPAPTGATVEVIGLGTGGWKVTTVGSILPASSFVQSSQFNESAVFQCLDGANNIWSISHSSGHIISGGSRGVLMGGSASGLFSGIEYITISTTANATNFGYLATVKEQSCGGSSHTRGICAGGATTDGVTISVIEHITIATTGNSNNFGYISSAVKKTMGGGSNAVRFVFGGGYSGVTAVSSLDYITIATTGNSSSFGYLYAGVKVNIGTTCSSSTKAIFMGGGTSGSVAVNIVDYVLFSSAGGSVDFGDLTANKMFMGACSNSIRGLCGGGFTGSAVVSSIDYITLANNGNASNFGNLSAMRYYLNAVSSSTRGVFYGGNNNVTGSCNILEYVTIAILSNTSDFGDTYKSSVQSGAGISNDHGGLQ